MWERVWVDVRTGVGKGMGGCEDGCVERAWVAVRTDVGKGMGGCEDGCGEGYGRM